MTQAPWPYSASEPVAWGRYVRSLSFADQLKVLISEAKSRAAYYGAEVVRLEGEVNALEKALALRTRLGAKGE